MYRVALATEETEQEILQEILQENFSEIWEFYFIKSQEMLLDIVEEGKVDMVFLSLPLEGFSGLKALQNLREKNKKIHVCVCSTFFAADMVTEVVMCGVDAYLSLPIKKVQVKQAVSKIIAELEEEKLQWIHQKGQETYLQQTRNILEYGFIYTILFGEMKERYLHAYCDALGMMYRGFMISIHPVGGLSEEEELAEKMQDKMKRIMKKYERSMVGPKMFDRFIIYASWSKEDMSERQKKEYLTKIGHDLKKGMMEELGVPVRIGIGNVYPIKDIYLSYQEAINSVYFKNVDKDNVMVFRRDEKFLSHREYMNMLNQLIEAVKFGRTEALDIFSKILVHLDDLEYNAQINKILQIMVLSCYVVPLEGENELQFLDCREFVKELEEGTELKSLAYRKFEYMFKVISKSRSAGIPATVHSAIQYIEENYTSEISLDDVAKHVGVTPQHFSKVFKSQTGMNYVDWIAHLRIEKAKQYLNVGDRTIKEICFFLIAR